MDVEGNKVLALCEVKVRNGILKYEAGGRGNSSVRKFGEADCNGPIVGTACVLFEGERTVKLSKNFIAADKCQICQKILSKFDTKHRIAAKVLFPCLLELVVFGE
jgi:hypothetical protein